MYVEYKIDHISKTKNCKIVKFSAKPALEHCASFGTKEIQTILRILIDHVSKTKNLKIVQFSAKSVSDHCVYFGKIFCSADAKNFEQPCLKN